MNAQQTNQFARELVAKALSERGVGSVSTVGTTKKLLIATRADGEWTVSLHVKSKRKGNWHTSTKEGVPASTIPIKEDTFWVFVELRDTPKFWIVPDWWIREILYRDHLRYLVDHGGHRPVNDASEHQSITAESIKDWENRWDILGIL